MAATLFNTKDGTNASVNFAIVDTGNGIVSKVIPSDATGNPLSATNPQQVALTGVTVKAASTQAVATDTALVVALSPNSVNPNGSAVSNASAPIVIASDQAWGGRKAPTTSLSTTPALDVAQVANTLAVTTAGTFFDLPVNGVGTVDIVITGFTAATGVVLSVVGSGDGGVSYQPMNAVGMGAITQTLSAAINSANIQQYRINASGHTNIRLVVATVSSVSGATLTINTISSATQGIVSLAAPLFGSISSAAPNLTAMVAAGLPNAPLSITLAGALRVDASSSIQPMIGDVYAGVTDSGKPVGVGGVVGLSSYPAVLTQGARVSALFTKTGKQVAVGAVREMMNRQFTSITGTAETTIATGIANYYIDLFSLIVTNTGSAAVNVTIKESTGGNTIFVFAIPAGDHRGFTIAVDSAVKQSVLGASWTATCSAAGTVNITALFVQNV